MSNRLEYSLLALSAVALVIVYVLYNVSGSIEDHEPPATAGSGISAPPGHLDIARPAEATNPVIPSRLRPSEEPLGDKSRGLNEIGLLYLNGNSVVRNLEASFEFFSLAAQNGDALAMANLARMYEMGWGTKADQGKALQWYAKAAELGNTLARDDWQRLREVIPKPSGAKLAKSPITAGPTPGSKTESPISNPGSIAAAGRATIQPPTKQTSTKQPSIKVVEPTAAPSPKTSGSTGAISFAAPDPAKVSDPKRGRMRAIEPPRKSTPPREISADQAARKPSRHLSTARSPKRPKAPTEVAKQGGKLLEPQRRTNSVGTADEALPVIVDATNSSAAAAVCDWKLVRCKSLQSPSSRKFSCGAVVRQRCWK